MSDKLPPCDHDECGPLKCSKPLSDTPRTHAAKFKVLSTLQSGTIEVVVVDVSEQLERDNNQLREALEGCVEELDFLLLEIKECELSQSDINKLSILQELIRRLPGFKALSHPVVQQILQKQP